MYFNRIQNQIQTIRNGSDIDTKIRYLFEQISDGNIYYLIGYMQILDTCQIMHELLIIDYNSIRA
jgi:hypothetical protein